MTLISRTLLAGLLVLALVSLATGDLLIGQGATVEPPRIENGCHRRIFAQRLRNRV
jgi:hypothetical protein